MTTTQKLLDELNALRRVEYPNIGFSFFADVAGMGYDRRRIYTIVNENGGVTFSHMNAVNPRKRCENIRAEIERVRGLGQCPG